MAQITLGRWRGLLLAAGLAAVCIAGCKRPTICPVSPQGRSLLGKDLYYPPIDSSKVERLHADVTAAKAAWEAAPDDESVTVWYGRRLGYVGWYRHAIEIYSTGLAKHPNSYRLLRHRGHRYITVREFDLALADLSRAAGLIAAAPDAVEPDGDPNPSNVPLSTDHSNIYYHLGLVLYLRGHFDESNHWFARRKNLASVNDDMVVSTTYWRYLCLMRLGRLQDAAALLEPIRPDLNVLENQSYFKLCLMFKGLLKEQDLLPDKAHGTLEAGRGYGVAMARRFAGNEAGCRAMLKRVVNETPWIGFGHIAAEAELARIAAQ